MSSRVRCRVLPSPFFRLRRMGVALPVLDALPALAVLVSHGGAEERDDDGDDGGDGEAGAGAANGDAMLPLRNCARCV